MSAAPPVAPVPWYQGQRFIALCQSSALLVLVWLIQSLTSNTWEWRGIAVAVLGNVLLQLKDWWNPNIVGPFDFTNKNNVPAPLAPSSVADAVKRQG